MTDPAAPLLQTPLHRAHRDAGAKLVPFAGYEMPVQYPLGILGEHLWTRENAGLFDVSHMGQAALAGPDWETVARALEALVPADLVHLTPGRQRYTQLLTEDGGILDDLMATRPATEAEASHLYLVLNASRKTADRAHIEARLPSNVRFVPGDERALLALQGPAAAAVLAGLDARVEAMRFMDAGWADLGGVRAHVSRSGYTGEDGFEVSVKAEEAEGLWTRLLGSERVCPVGLGARDSLRLEAGLCLYGHDIDETTSPVEAGLAWSIQKRRRESGGFPGAVRIGRELRDGPTRVRVGLKPDGRQPAREGAEIVAGGRVVGRITSGGFGPSVDGPVAMGYVERTFAEPGTSVALVVRGRELPTAVAPFPFTPHRYAR